MTTGHFPQARGTRLRTLACLEEVSATQMPILVAATPSISSPTPVSATKKSVISSSEQGRKLEKVQFKLQLGSQSEENGSRAAEFQKPSRSELEKMLSLTKPDHPSLPRSEKSASQPSNVIFANTDIITSSADRRFHSSRSTSNTDAATANSSSPDQHSIGNVKLYVPTLPWSAANSNSTAEMMVSGALKSVKLITSPSTDILPLSTCTAVYAGGDLLVRSSSAATSMQQFTKTFSVTTSYQLSRSFSATRSSSSNRTMHHHILPTPLSQCCRDTPMPPTDRCRSGRSMSGLLEVQTCQELKMCGRFCKEPLLPTKIDVLFSLKTFAGRESRSSSNNTPLQNVEISCDRCLPDELTNVSQEDMILSISKVIYTCFCVFLCVVCDILCKSTKYE